jgi:hypothetical protein
MLTGPVSDGTSLAATALGAQNTGRAIIVDWQRRTRSLGARPAGPPPG